jgi:hypothetical protein
MFGIDDAVSAGLGIVGLGMQLWAGQKQAENAKQQAQVSQGITADEQKVNEQKYQLTQLEANRAQLENFRNVQRLRAQSTAAAVAGGAQYGSGLPGGQAEIQNRGVEGSLGVSQGLSIATNIFGINKDISGKEIQLAGLKGQAAEYQGYASIGGSLMKAGPTLGAFASDIFSGKSK